MKQITGASELIAKLYGRFIPEEKEEEPSESAGGSSSLTQNEFPFVNDGQAECASPLASKNLHIRNDWRWENPRPLLENGWPKLEMGEDGAVVYEGGGNLLVLYRDRESFIKANRVFSQMVIEEAYSLSPVCAAVDWERSEDKEVGDFEWNRTRVFAQFDRMKRLSCESMPCNVLPYTQVDRVSFQPIVKKDDPDYGDITREGVAKKREFDDLSKEKKDEGRYIDNLVAEKGVDSLIAVLYFDGNSIGERVKSAVSDRIERGMTEIEAMRDFSKELQGKLVEDTKGEMKKALRLLCKERGLNKRYEDFRIIIDHGDEITFICNAHSAPFVLDAYFEALKGSSYHACGGMAICHSHDPFAEVYRIAEECCESGKKANRDAQNAAMEGLEGEEARRAYLEADDDFVDFHFCRSGITGTLEQIRSAQDAHLIGRPYRVRSEYATFLHVGETLAQSHAIKRADLKALNRAILRGDSWYALEYERIKAKDPATMGGAEAICGVLASASPSEKRGAMRSILFDVTSFYDVYDLRFGATTGEEEEDV